MVRSKFLISVALTVLASIALAYASYRYGVRTAWSMEDRDLAATQAMLAFAGYKTYEEIESLLMQQCYEAAMTLARESKDMEVVLIYENLRESENDPELMEYLRIRDAELLEDVLAGRVPELEPFEYECLPNTPKAREP